MMISNSSTKNFPLLIITNEDEVLEEVKALQLEVNEKVKKMGKEN
jgi:hypothetical protein